MISLGQIFENVSFFWEISIYEGISVDAERLYPIEGFENKSREELVEFGKDYNLVGINVVCGKIRLHVFHREWEAEYYG